MSASAEPTKGRDSLMKMLLTNSSIPLQKNRELGAICDRDLDLSEDNLHETFVSYIQALTGSSKRRIPLVWMEHSYACVGGGQGTEGGNSGTGARLLLVRKAPQCPDCHTQTQEEQIDVETVEPEPTPPLLLDDIPPCEKPIEDGELTPEENEDKVDWEDKLHSLAWNPAQVSLLTGALDAVLGARAALLSAGRAGARRAAARGGAARQLRALLAAPPARWQPRLVQWLHNALTEHLPPPMLSCYREIMLTLKSKVPSLVEKMTMGHPLVGRVRGYENGAGGPTIASGSTGPPDPAAPVLLLLPSGRDRRDARWAERLRAVANVQQVHSHQSGWLPQLPLSACLAQLLGTGRARAAALKAEYPQRPIILVGQGAGAAIAVQLAVNMQGIAGVVCLGLPLLTASGPRGDPEDCLLDIPCPVLFVIGQNANQCTQQDVESLRLKLKVRSRLVVAGGADDLLRLPRLKRHLEGVTQRMVECAIAEEVGNFLSCLSQWENSMDEEGRSSPEGSVGADTEAESLPPLRPPSPAPAPLPSPIQIIGRTPGQAKRKLMDIGSPKPKKPRLSRNLKASPLKARGMALYKVNNPPPEGATISIGQILSTAAKDDDDSFDEGSGMVIQNKRVEPASYIQISNNRLTRNIPQSGNGKSKDLNVTTGIKVLENIPCKLSKFTTSRLVGAFSGPTKANTPIILPRIASSQQQVTNTQASTSINTTNIMDIPIIFADDDKSIVNQQNKSPQKKNSPTSGIKAIIINKQSLGNNSGEIKQRINAISGQTPSKNIVQVKVKPTTIGQSPINSNQMFHLKNSNAPNNTLKYTKVILAKRTPDATNNSAVIDNSKSAPGAPGKRISNPIIVKGKGSKATFKVLPGTVFYKGHMATHQRQLIIQRASPGNLNNKSNSNKKRDDIMCENSTSDRAIEAAVASITGEQEDLGEII